MRIGRQKVVVLAACLLLGSSRSVDAEVAESLSDAQKAKLAAQPPVTVSTAVGELTLPPPYASEPTTKRSQVVPWPEGAAPRAPDGFTVTRFAEDLDHPRRVYIAPTGEGYFVALSDDARNSPNRIVLLRDANGDGSVDKRFEFASKANGLNQPYGMAVVDGYFYVGNVDSVMRWPYRDGMTRLEGEGERIAELPAGGYNHHWTRNLLATNDGGRLLVTVGSSSNVGEHGMEEEERRACILAMNPDGSGEELYASGLRNPVGMDYNPVTGELWTAVNERDEIGDNLVPDYLTSVRRGGWYGWPYSYYGDLPDPRWGEDPHEELASQAIVPDVPVGSHTASLGLAFYTGDKFPERYHQGAFVGQHGSWNRAKFAGYKVVFVPFDEAGRPQPPEDFLAGFIADGDASQVYGRPVSVEVTTQGDLLVSDDDGGVIWRVSYNK
ncbi:Membrane bound L-sorbosone dehydrogenase [Posidoniimonas polymericola]|uniref:Membrane bound L-sorbosone dehydrogenase n=1 Tax=Posidoniimonas polymericola TaxID=2528002 RepID=A0A5C5YTQ7_9BACT|nr:sorbosone dehydrogenase family protein [Posidoniimonas polymericola]TWT78379.1 Membrane bound L-sorbosone dehydrogenase [Posidoniimonas polymericola]